MPSLHWALAQPVWSPEVLRCVRSPGWRSPSGSLRCVWSSCKGRSPWSPACVHSPPASPRSSPRAREGTSAWQKLLSEGGGKSGGGGTTRRGSDSWGREGWGAEAAPRWRVAVTEGACRPPSAYQSAHVHFRSESDGPAGLLSSWGCVWVTHTARHEVGHRRSW